MPDTASPTVYGKQAPNGDTRIVYKQYVGVEVPLKGGKPGRLGKYDIRRLRSREQANRSRVRAVGLDAIVDAVDFIAVLIAQEWRCWICKELMDAALHGTEPDAISVEHDPAVSVCREHTLRTVKGAHQRCNHAKAAAEDTTRAAKIKRVIKDEDKHRARMEAKARLSREAFKRQRREEAKLVSRNTFAKRAPSLLSPSDDRETRAPSAWSKPLDYVSPLSKKYRERIRAARKPAVENS